ncbi:MAG: M56 family metallopeptidase [Ruminococcaceae bacterium]|nr:M56 family metallopeptidase [Oscillospiraceae bacterium]
MGFNLDQIFLALVNRSVAAAWVVAAVLILRFVLRKAPKQTRCLLWALVAVRLMFSLSIPSSWSVFNLADTPLNESGVIEFAEYTGEGVQPSAVFERPALTVSTGADGGQPSVTMGAEREYVSLPELSHLWLVGVGGMLLYALFSYLKLRRRVAASIERSGVRLCDEIDTPFILGVLAPRIYVPSSLTEPQLSHVLAHERAHLKRRDHWWKPLGFVLLAVYWFNPVLWLAYILLCRDIELACDERVYCDMAIAERADYSQTLLEQSCPRVGVAACPLAFGEVGVRERVRAALDYQKPTFWAVVAAGLVCIVAAVCFLTNPATLKIDFAQDDILGIEAYCWNSEKQVSVVTQPDGLSGELCERLFALKNLRRGGYTGMTPLYTLTLRVAYKGAYQLRGYNDDGTMTELYFEDWARGKGTTWRVKDDEFGRYVMNVCKYGDGQPTDFLVAEYDPAILSVDDLDALGEKYGFRAVRNFGRGDLFSACFDRLLTKTEADDIGAALSGEDGILLIGYPETERGIKTGGPIFLYGERHGAAALLNRLLELWKRHYQEEGMRDLFIEVPGYTAAFLNLWMLSDNNDILDQLYRDWDGTAAHTQRQYDFYLRIRQECPDTVFHGVDVGHQYDTTGERYLVYLRDSGFDEDSDEYRRTQEAIAQGQNYYRTRDKTYRENTMAENFIREYESLDGAGVMGIFGSAHIGIDLTDGTAASPSLASLLRACYGDILYAEDLNPG